ncbi:MAG: ATP-binding protein, partial [Proteobacteria bacterium]|nr:ATP-binding protein [Pseudomonadota bacterium]
MTIPFSIDVAAFRRSLAARSDLRLIDLDRLAVAFALHTPAKEKADSPRRMSQEHGTEWEYIDAFDDGPALGPCIAVLNGADTVEHPDPHQYVELLHKGYAILEAQYQECGQNWTILYERWLHRWGGQEARPQTQSKLIEIVVGQEEANGNPVIWHVNRETDNANVRIAGAPGAGKSQCLMHLLASIGHKSDAGFVLLDYKGDLCTNEIFVGDMGARVIRLDQEELPINPFQLPDGTHQRLAPRSFAEVFASVSKTTLGDVQIELLTRAMERAYEPSLARSEAYPTLAEVGDAVEEVYAEEGRTTDAVIANLRSLADLGIFSQRSEFSHDQVFRQRWVLDLSRLGPLRDFVAFTLLQFLAQAAQGLSDANFDAKTHARQIRGIVAVDEAHFYLAKRCAPLLQLIRIGRSKGIPVFLASQSLEDFKQHTELAEFLPNTFLLRHGLPQDARRVAGAMGVRIETARKITDRLTSLPQFHACCSLATSDTAAPIVRLNPFF